MTRQTTLPFIKGKKFSATIAKGKDGVIHIRVLPGEPRIEDGETLIEVLHGDDEEELAERALRFAKEQA